MPKPKEIKMARTPVRKVNKKRRAERFTEAFGVGGGKAEFVRELGCVVGLSTCDRPIHAHHVKTRGAGGTSKHLVGLCNWHHYALHATGARTFEQNYRLNLKAIAADLEQRYQEEANDAGH
jgi:hypothetical protein